jgi:hypothetical protein
MRSAEPILRDGRIAAAKEERGVRSDKPAEEANDAPPAGGALRAGRAERIVQAVVAAFLAGALAVGRLLVPSPTGADTHTQLGLPPCSMLQVTGRPCPTCGVTTAFALAARGEVVRALVTQPFGLVCFLATVGSLALVAVALASGRSLVPLMWRLRPGLLVIILLIILLLSWAYKWHMVVNAEDGIRNTERGVAAVPRAP